MQTKIQPRINVGVIGGGYWGPNLAAAFASFPDCHMAMICDRDRGTHSRLQGLHPNACITDDYTHMFNGANLNAVIVATPLESHHPLAMRALMEGRNVLIEKPMAATSQQCRELIAAIGVSV